MTAPPGEPRADPDADLRRHVAGMDTPVFAETAFTGATRLEDATVALVTSAGLHLEGHPGWTRGDQTFTVIPEGRRDVRIGHVSPNFDRAGMAYDLNVVFPADRLRELAQRGDIAAVAPAHLSFMGAQHGNLTTIALDSGPAAARALRDAGADVAVLTPVCPLCTRTLGAVAHALEDAGIATVLIALVREHAERMRPPRALYCEFPFGRPLGLPGNPEFQTEVLSRALSLVERPAGPVLEDMPERIRSDGSETFDCALPPPHDATAHPAVDEAAALRPAYERRLARTGRTLVGRAVSAEEVPAALGVLARAGESAGWAPERMPWDPALAALDVRSYYEEAAVELTGAVPASRAVDRWFFEETLAGRALVAAQTALRAAGAPREVWYYLIPRSYHG